MTHEKSGATKPEALPLVSVVVPTLNRAQLLDRTLRSIRALDYPNLDILVSDNGSTDRTPETIAQHAEDPRLRSRRNQATIDMVSHWNQCLWEARGEYVVLVSDDDLVSESFVRRQVELFTKYPSITVTMPRTEMINHADEITQRIKPVEWERLDGVEFLCQWLWGTGRNPTGAFLTTMMRTKMALALGGWPHFPGGANADNALFLAIALQGSVGFCHDACFQYRVDTQSHGLKVDFEALSESSRRFRKYMASPELVRLLGKHEREVQRKIVGGVSHMLARQYFYRMYAVVAARRSGNTGATSVQEKVVAQSLSHLPNSQLVRAIVDYKLDWESARSFATYAGKTIKKAAANRKRQAA